MVKKTKRAIVELWLRANRDIINATSIERILNLPLGTISKFLRQNRRIKDDRIKKIHALLEKRRLIENIYNINKTKL